MPRGSGSAQLIFGGKDIRVVENNRKEDYHTTLLKSGSLEKVIQEFASYSLDRRQAVMSGWGNLLFQKVLECEEDLLKKYFDKTVDFLSLKDMDKCWQEMRYHLNQMISEEFLGDIFSPSRLDVHKLSAAVSAFENKEKDSKEFLAVMASLRDEVGDFVDLKTKEGIMEEVRWVEVAQKQGFAEFFKSLFYILNEQPGADMKEACADSLAGLCWLEAKHR